MCGSGCTDDRTNRCNPWPSRAYVPPIPCVSLGLTPCVPRRPAPSFSFFLFSFLYLDIRPAASNDNLNVLAYHRRQAYIKPKNDEYILLYTNNRQVLCSIQDHHAAPSCCDKGTQLPRDRVSERKPSFWPHGTNSLMFLASSPEKGCV